MSKVKKTFKFTLHGKAKDGSQSKYPFSDEMEAGAMSVVLMTYELENEEAFNHPMFLMNLINQGDEIRDQMIGMKVEEIADDGSTLQQM